MSTTTRSGRRERVLALLAQLADVLLEDDAPANAVSPSPAPDSDALLDKRGIADVLGVSPAQIDRFDRLGQPHRVVGDCKRYARPDVLAWHAARPPRVKPPRAPKAEVSR